MLPLGEPVKRCLLGPLKRFLGGLGVPTLSFEVPTGEFDASTDSFDGRVDGFEVSAAGFGFLPNGSGFPSALSGGLVIPDVVPDRFGVPAGGFVFSHPDSSAWRRPAEVLLELAGRPLDLREQPRAVRRRERAR